MKRLSTIIMALVLALGLTQCKKDQPNPNVTEGETYTINLSVKGNSNAKLDVNTTTGTVDYTTGDQIHVASGGKYVGTLTYNGTVFTGNITNAVEGEPLQFYFLGNVTPAEELTSGVTESCSVVISDQTDHLPVISGAASVEIFEGNNSDYTAELLNKCALVKFNVTTASTAPTCLKGFNNKVTIDFGQNSFTNSQEGEGIITLPAGNGEQWAILLPQEAMNGGEAYSANESHNGTFGAVPAIYANAMFTVGVPVEVNTVWHNIVDLTPLSESYTAQDGDIITGTANGSFSLRIPGDVSVTLRNVDCTEEFGIVCFEPEQPGEHSVSINLEGNNSAWNLIQVASIKNLTIGGDGRLDLGNNMSFGPGCNTTIEGTTITGSLIYMGDEYSGEENTLTIDGGSVSFNGGMLAYNNSNINIENDGNLTVHVTKDDWFSTVFPGIEGSSGSEVNVTITDGVNGNSNLTIISCENSFTGDKFIQASSITFGTTNVKSAWDAKTWSADGYQNFGPLRATYTASSYTLVLAPAPAQEYVDLGLPSGLLWATCNVGADNPEDYGDYFAWGETQPKDTYNWSTYQYCKGSYNKLTKYCNSSSYGYSSFTDNLTTLLPVDDAATANWGSDWRMPTKADFEELYNNTTVTWTQLGGVNGRLFTAKNRSGNSLFLPAAGRRVNAVINDVGSNGYYWSSSLHNTNSSKAWYSVFTSGYQSMDYYFGERSSGFSVRAVRPAPQN